MRKRDHTGARAHFERALTAPRNLGEAKHLLANESDIHFWLGCALFELGQHEDAPALAGAPNFRGDFQEMSVRVFSEMTYYSALALERLGQRARSRALLRGLLDYARLLEKTPAKIDYFATSLPAMLLFDDDASIPPEDDGAVPAGAGAARTGREIRSKDTVARCPAARPQSSAGRRSAGRTAEMSTLAPNARPDCSVCREGEFSAYVMRSPSVEVVVVPELGGRIVRIGNIKTGREWLWHPPGKLNLFRNNLGDDFSRSPLAGLDECLPTIEPCQWRGRQIPDHGEVWSAAWSVNEAAWKSGALRTEAHWRFRRLISSGSLNCAKMKFVFLTGSRVEVKLKNIFFGRCTRSWQCSRTTISCFRRQLVRC